MRRWAALAVALVLTACGTVAPAAPAQPPCALPSLPPDAGVGGPAVVALPGGAATAGFSLDGGLLQVMPPASGERPSVSLGQAECDALAALDGSNAPLVGAALQSGIAIGYGRVSIAPSLVAGAKAPPAYPDALPKPAPYQGRLAWAFVFRERFVSSCPAMTQPPAPRSPIGHDYGVFVLDGQTGGDALLYVEGHAAPCGGTARVAPAVTIPVEQVSVAWTLVSRHANGYSARIEAGVLPCDVYPDSVLVDRSQPVVRVVVLRPVAAACGPARQVTLALHAATVTSSLPAQIGHAPVGLYIPLPEARPPVRATGVLRTLGPADAGKTVEIGVGSVVVVPPLPGVRGANPAVSSDTSVLGPLDGGGRGPVAEFRGWKTGSADLTIPASACTSAGVKTPPCSGPWVVHVKVMPVPAGAG
jgi:hypothetical protein